MTDGTVRFEKEVVRATSADVDFFPFLGEYVALHHAPV